MNPKISIVTIAKNEEKNILETLESIKNQSYINYECIIIEGNSIDQTFFIANEFIKNNNKFKLFKQKSKGISNAFNEGVLNSDSDYILFINAGDKLKNSSSLEILAKYSLNYPNALICCKTEYISEFGIKSGVLFPNKEDLSKALFWSCEVSHQSTLIPTNIFNILGGYSPCFKIAMDYEFWLRCLINNYSFKLFSEVVSEHRVGGVSFTNLSRSRLVVIIARWINLKFLRLSLIKDFIQLMLILTSIFKIRKKHIA